MSVFHRVIRVAVFDLLSAVDFGAPVHSSPPPNLRAPIILIGAIAADEPLTKDDSSGWYSFSVESWVQSASPAELDGMSDGVATALDNVKLESVEAELSDANFISEQDSFNPDSPGGPTLGRVQTFRVFAQSLDQ